MVVNISFCFNLAAPFVFVFLIFKNDKFDFLSFKQSIIEELKFLLNCFKEANVKPEFLKTRFAISFVEYK